MTWMEPTARPAPFARSYWAVPGMLLAGCYPGDAVARQADDKLRALLACGIRCVVTLMEPDEVDHAGRPFVSYADRLRQFAAEVDARVVCHRHAIRDMGVPTLAQMERILDTIDGEIAAGRPVYVHCWGGHGRTGTVVGCYLARHGLASGEAALQAIGALRRRAAEATGHQPSPQTDAQRRMVREWPVGKGPA